MSLPLAFTRRDRQLWPDLQARRLDAPDQSAEVPAAPADEDAVSMLSNPWWEPNPAFDDVGRHHPDRNPRRQVSNRLLPMPPEDLEALRARDNAQWLENQLNLIDGLIQENPRWGTTRAIVDPAVSPAYAQPTAIRPRIPAVVLRD